MKNLRKPSSRNSDKFINLKTTNVKVDYISPFERLISHFVNFLFEGNGNLFKWERLLIDSMFAIQFEEIFGKKSATDVNQARTGGGGGEVK